MRRASFTVSEDGNWVILRFHANSEGVDLGLFSSLIFDGSFAIPSGADV